MARRWAIVLSVTATIAAIGLPVLASPAQSQESQAFTLDLSAKTQEWRSKVKFFATATAASTLVADGKDIKETTKQLAANEKTEIKAELTQSFITRWNRATGSRSRARRPIRAAPLPPTRSTRR